jgi:hypothetical protein
MHVGWIDRSRDARLWLWPSASKMTRILGKIFAL